MSGRTWQERIQRRQMREAMQEQAERSREDGPGIFSEPPLLAVPSPFSVGRFLDERGRAAELEPDREGPEYER